jgi:hypothetical protein
MAMTEKPAFGTPVPEDPDPSHPQDGEARSGRFPPGLWRRFAILLCGAFMLGVAMTLVVLWAMSYYFDEMAISGTPLVAALIGGGLSMVVGAGLMAALFYSDRSRWDEEVTDATTRR